MHRRADQCQRAALLRHASAPASLRRRGDAVTAPAFLPGRLGPAQQAALHVGPQDASPFDPRALVLYGRSGGDPKDGFAAGTLDQIEIEPCHMLMELAPAPGAERRLIEASGSFGSLKPPLNVAAAARGTVYLTDRGNALVKYFDPCDCAFKPLPCISTAPAATTNTHRFVPLDRVGCAWSGTQLLMADRGPPRVVVVALMGGVPRAALRLPGATGLRALWSPFAVAADSRRRIYVSDPDHARLDLFSPEGRWLKGWTAMGAIGALAIDCEDRLYAVIGDYARDTAGNPDPAAVEICDGAIKPVADDVAQLRARFPRNPVSSDNAGRLHLLCASGQTAMFDLQGLPVAEKSTAALPVVAKSGSYLSRPLDSRRRGCIWHRAVLTGDLPAKTRIDVQTTTSDVPLNDAELADLPAQAWSAPISVRSMMRGVADCLVMSSPGRYLWLNLAFAGDGKSTPRLSRIVFEYPRVSLRRYMPAVFGMDPVSADFTDRFTALFDTTLRSIERRIDTFYELFDPATAPAASPRGNPATDFLSWLASWIGVTLGAHWPEALRRAMLKAAPQLYTLRGTRYGLWRQLLVFLGLDRNCDGACEVTRCKALPLNCAPPLPPCPNEPPPLILEHFKLRRWLFLGAGKLGDDSVLWGQRIVNRSQLDSNARLGPLSCPPDRRPATQVVSTPDPLRDPFLVYANRFSVFVPARVKQRSWQRKGLEKLLAQESPAEALWQIEYVEPRIRVGVQAMIGLDSVIARVPSGIKLNDNALGRGTVLPPRPSSPLRTGDARVGETMRLN